MQSYDDVLQHVAQPSKAPTALSYAICATPRSGSTLLCECPQLTGVAGVPDEWLLRSNESLAKGSFSLETTFDDPGYFAEIVARSRTPNGVFGVKLMWPEIDALRSLTTGPHAVAEHALHPHVEARQNTAGDLAVSRRQDELLAQDETGRTSSDSVAG